uniref:Uncharacterized protein n=1 Tax=Timema poppense TaxID=170557 RepID=A0A7R9HAS8_TIMPO|nr:unnamed protein product [Timema poppensis]
MDPVNHNKVGVDLRDQWIQSTITRPELTSGINGSSQPITRPELTSGINGSFSHNKTGVDLGDQWIQYNPFQHWTAKWWRRLAAFGNVKCLLVVQFSAGQEEILSPDLPLNPTLIQQQELWTDPHILSTAKKYAVKRLKSRNNLSESAAIARIQAQPSNTTVVQEATVVFCTLWQPEFTQKQVERAWHLLQEYLS